MPIKDIDQEKLSRYVEGSNGECIPKFVAYNGSLQIAHWMADTSSNEHRTLGELYDKMISLTDDFAEVYMGKYGVIDFPSDAKIKKLTKPASNGLLIVQEAESYLGENDDDLLNITADMKIALNKAKYLLKE